MTSGSSQSEESEYPTFWIEFATFDDGLPALPPTSSLTPASTTFPQFNQLPTELRLKIWSYLVQPRIVVACCLQRDSRFAQRRQQFLDRCRHPPAPVLLHICHESRYVALRHYECSFSWNISKLISDTPVSGPARVWFNFDLDALYLTGELEAYDSYGFNSPMVYFLCRDDARRVKHIACPFAELGYPEQESDQIFGCLWHVVDRFPAAGRLLLTVTDRDEEHMSDCALLSPDNIMQKIWSGWMCGTTVTSSRMADKQMLLIREDGLADFVAHQ